jgi:hypothetical protein
MSNRSIDQYMHDTSSSSVYMGRHPASLSRCLQSCSIPAMSSVTLDSFLMAFFPFFLSLAYTLGSILVMVLLTSVTLDSFLMAFFPFFLSFAYTLGSILVMVLLTIATFSVYVSIDGTDSRREWFSRFPMGAARTKCCKKVKVKPHAICQVENHTYESWVNTLPRSCRATLTKQLPKCFSVERITVRECRPSDLGWRHLRVIYSHERRQYNFARAALAAVIRFLVASLMVGTVDEFYDHGGSLLAWSHGIVKGQAYRAMWFYQTKDAASRRYFLWFKTLDLAVQRSCQLPERVKFIDLGPSLNKNVTKTKEKFGFPSRHDWHKVCGYEEGPFYQL